MGRPSPRIRSPQGHALPEEMLRHDDLLELRRLSLEARGKMIESACRSAAAIYRSRIEAGLPDVVPDPWPDSTLDFFQAHAAKRNGL